MKDPHDSSEYKKVEGSAEGTNRKGKKLSGSYYYVDTEEPRLAELSFNRTVLTIIALVLQLIVLALPQGGSQYVLEVYPSYAYTYVMIVLVAITVAVWLIIMSCTRYKIAKRIPVERAPKHGFARRAYFGNELYIGSNAAVAAVELSFVCICYDYVGLISFFVCLLATGAAVWARIITHRALMNAQLITAPDAETNEQGS